MSRLSRKKRRRTEAEQRAERRAGSGRSAYAEKKWTEEHGRPPDPLAGRRPKENPS